MNRSKIGLYILFVVLYFWSSHIYYDWDPTNSKSAGPPRQIEERSPENEKVLQKFDFQESKILRHYESNNTDYDYIMNSSVCPLGKLAFWLWTIILLLLILSGLIYGNSLNYFLEYFKKTLLFFWALTVVLMLVLNVPLFIRSIPAFIVLLGLLI
jgi:hypothetical protein